MDQFRTTIEVEFHIAGIIITRLCDVLYHYYKTKDEKDSQVSKLVKAITQEEYDGLQNLSGYVVHQLLKKSKGKSGNKLVAPLLISFITDNIDNQP